MVSALENTWSKKRDSPTAPVATQPSPTTDFVTRVSEVHSTKPNSSLMRTASNSIQQQRRRGKMVEAKEAKATYSDAWQNKIAGRVWGRERVIRYSDSKWWWYFPYQHKRGHRWWKLSVHWWQRQGGNMGWALCYAAQWQVSMAKWHTQIMTSHCAVARLGPVMADQWMSTAPYLMWGLLSTTWMTWWALVGFVTVPLPTDVACTGESSGNCCPSSPPLA